MTPTTLQKTDYLVMIAEGAAATPACAAQRIAAHADYASRLGSALLDAGRLHPAGEGKRVRPDRVEDGSFDGAFDRYYLLRADGLDGALMLAADIPLGESDTLELRPVLGGRVERDKLDRPGQLFAFSVVGAAPDEPSWSALMDRIEEETRDGFPSDRFAGGMRLQAPTTARKIVLDTSKRRVLDGPFLESKEVIGGLFFMRMASLDEAVRWGAASPFLHHAALEIRELWRT